jgi:DNA polymerase III epsilon subunit-like protein
MVKMKVVVFDTETTGLIANRAVRDSALPRIIDFYAALVDLDRDDPPAREIEHLLDPGEDAEIPEKVTKITGLTLADLRGRPRFLDVATEVRDFMMSGEAVLAHNCSFDREVLQIELDRAGVPIKWPRSICSVEQTMHLRGHRLSLGALHELLFGKPHPDAHRARSDAEATIRIARELRKRGELE